MRTTRWIMVLVLVVAWMVCIANVAAQTKTITMQRAIMLAQQQSIAMSSSQSIGLVIKVEI